MTKLTANIEQDVIRLIKDAKNQAAVAVNAELTLLYWQVGKRIVQAVLKGERADYGKQVIADLATSLTQQFGKRLE